MRIAIWRGVFLQAVALTFAGGAALAQPCVVPDDGSGTVFLPPPGCGYLSPTDVHMIIDGLPAGTTILVGAQHSDFFNVTHAPGGGLGGETETFDSMVQLHLTGTDGLAGFERFLAMQVVSTTETGPRTPGDPVQAFPNEMVMLQGQLPPGDPDFDLLRITAGSGFGMPSPGHTTLTQLPGGNWNVDSFFDIAYRIDFVGHPGGPLGGMSGSTTGTIRMATGEPVSPIPPCVVADNGTGTINLPPPGCGYVSPDDLHMIIDGLPSGTEIQVSAEHARFFNVTTAPGGSLGGEVESFDSTLDMHLTGLGIDREIEMQVQCQTHTGPRTPGDPVQSFDTDMFALQGQLPPGDRDFDLLRITAGTGFGMPSPGHTTLIQLPGGSWAVDSFFDITYRIDFVGHPGGPLGGMSGSTTGTIRMQAGTPAGSCPPLPPGTDAFPSTGKVVIELFGPGSEPFVGRLSSAGLPDAVVQRGVQSGDTIPIELVQLSLLGNHPQVGRMRIRESPTLQSVGQLTNVIQDPVTCGLLQADSFFDVFVEIDLLDLGQTWITDRPIHLRRKIGRLPPENEPYENPYLDPVTLIDVGSGTPQGRILYHLHHADPPFPPRGADCIDTILTANLSLPGLGFSGQIQATGPTMVQRQSPVVGGQCSVSLTPCTKDGDCPVGEVCGVFSNQIQTEIVSMNLTGAAPIIGNFQVDVTPLPSSPPLPPSLGQASSQSGHSTYAADSFFDVFFEIELPMIGGRVRTGVNPVHVDAFSLTGPGMRNTPPDPGSPFQQQPGAPVPLFTEDGGFVGTIGNVVHVVGPPEDWTPPPPPDDECFESWVHLHLTIDNPFCEEDLRLPGGFRVLHGAPSDPLANGQELIQTLMAKLDLRGTSSCIGPLRVGLAPGVPSGGSVSSLAPAEFFPADSFFDVFVELDTGIGPLTTSGSTHMTTTINALPPDEGEIYYGPGTVIPIFDAFGAQIGSILEVSHEVREQIECPVDCLPYIRGLAGGSHDVSIVEGGGGVLYDIVQGLLSDLRASGGDFTSAFCVGNDAPSLITLPDPPPGDAFYIVARDVFAEFNGSWESSGPGQVGLRSPELAGECD